MLTTDFFENLPMEQDSWPAYDEDGNIQAPEQPRYRCKICGYEFEVRMYGMQHESRPFESPTDKMKEHLELLHDLQERRKFAGLDDKEEFH